MSKLIGIALAMGGISVVVATSAACSSSTTAGTGTHASGVRSHASTLTAAATTTPSTASAPTGATPSAARTWATKDSDEVGTQLNLTDVDKNNSSNTDATVYIKITPVGKTRNDWKDGTTPARAHAFKVRMYDKAGSAYVATFEALSGQPAHGGSFFFRYKDGLDNTASFKSMCGKLKPLDTVVGQNADDDYTLSQGDVFTGCVVMDWFGKKAPTEIDYHEKDYGIGPYMLWSGKLSSHGALAKPTTLAIYSGSESDTVHVPHSVRHATGLKMCWDFTSYGNHILEGESDTSGSDLYTYTNTLGSSDKGCRGVMGTLEPYLQVIAEGDWSIKLKGYK